MRSTGEAHWITPALARQAAGPTKRIRRGGASCRSPICSPCVITVQVRQVEALVVNLGDLLVERGGLQAGTVACLLSGIPGPAAKGANPLPADLRFPQRVPVVVPD